MRLTARKSKVAHWAKCSLLGVAEAGARIADRRRLAAMSDEDLANQLIYRDEIPDYVLRKRYFL